MMKTSTENSPCLCGSKKSYAYCCEALHKGAPAASAEALMRSRYTAFALGLDEYILRSWHASKRPSANDVNIDEKPRWIGLQIKHHEQSDSNRATVEFIARYKINGRAFLLHETSRFVRENGHWFYVDGELVAI
jgi:SEC-C motif-containing protein